MCGAELALAFEPGEVPNTCCATRPGTPAALADAVCRRDRQQCSPGGVLNLRLARDGALSAEHEYYERTLRGQFIPEAEVAKHMDWPADQKLPGYTQLMRPRDRRQPRVSPGRPF